MKKILSMMNKIVWPVGLNISNGLTIIIVIVAWINGAIPGWVTFALVIYLAELKVR